MRAITVLTAAMTAVLVAGVTTPTGAVEPGEVRWENRIAEQAWQTSAGDVAVSADGTKAYAVGGFQASAQDGSDAFVHAVDVATGATLWTTTLDQDLSVGDVAVDPTTGQILTGGTRWKDGKNHAVVTAFSPTGEQVWTSAVPGRVFFGMAVDAATGQVCVVSATGTGSTWTTQCWSRSGQVAFSQDYRSRSNSWPDEIVIDDVTHRIFVAGARTRKFKGLVTTLAYNARGRTLWQRSTRVSENYPYVQGLAVDPKARRLYLLVDEERRALVIGQRTTNGRTAFTRILGSGRAKTPRPKFIDVLPRSHRVVVTSHSKPRYRGTLRYLDERGRQVATAGFHECCDLTEPVVDLATDRISIAWGPGSFDDGEPTEDDGVGAATWDSRGNKVTDLEISSSGQVRAVAAIASAGEDLLVLGDRPFSNTGGPRGSFLVAVR